jgi:metal transporter CNNM
MLFEETPINPIGYCHRPIIVKDPSMPLGNVLCQLKECAHCTRDDIIDQDVILIWGQEEKRVITGTDILGRLLKGI